MTEAGRHTPDRRLLSAAMLGVASGAILVPLNSTMLAVALPGVMGEFGLDASAGTLLEYQKGLRYALHGCAPPLCRIRSHSRKFFCRERCITPRMSGFRIRCAARCSPAGPAIYLKVTVLVPPEVKVNELESLPGASNLVWT